MQYPRYGRLSLDLAGDGSLYVSRRFDMEVRPGVIESIHPGFTTDLASFPRILRPFVDPWGPWGEPAVFHDHDYRYGRMSRLEADQRFLAGMRARGAPWWKRASIYRSLRLFGWWAWRKHRRRDLRA